MILSDSEILRRMKSGDIVIEPFDRECLGSNSYDVHLSEYIKIYTNTKLYADRDNDCEDIMIRAEGDFYLSPGVRAEGGFCLSPGELYLASTIEYTETRGCVPFLEGKSSGGRLGISIHATAGKGDAGFCNHWTLELSVVQPVVVYAGMPIGQLIYFAMLGEVERPYDTKPNSTQRTARDPKPVPSGMWKNFRGKR